MHQLSRTRLSLGTVLLVLLTCLPATLLLAEADNSTKENTAEERKKAEIAPRLEESLLSFIKTLSPKHTKRAKESIREAIDETVEAAGLDRDTSEVLEEAGKKAVTEAEAKWNDAAMKSMQKMYGKRLFDEDVVDSLVESLDQAIANTEMLPDSYRVTADILPTETDAWKNALKTTLSDKQRASLVLTDEQKEKLARKKYAALVKQSAERYRQHFSTKIEREVDDIKGTLAIDDERREKLDTAATEAIDKSLKELEGIQMAAVLKASPSSRKSYLQRGYISSSISEVTQPHESKLWKSSIEGLLSEKERKDFAAFAKTRKERAIQAGADLLTAALDDLLYFNSEQRTKVSKLLRKPAEDRVYRSLTEPNYSLSLNLQQVVQYGQALDKKKFNAILLDWQRTFWNEHAAELARGQPAAPKKKKKKGSKEPAVPLAPPGEEGRLVEKVILDQIFARAPSHFALIRAEYDGRLEAVHQTTQLSDRQRTKLEIAVKGAATLQQEKWVNQLDAHLRQQVKGQQPDIAVKRLEAITNVSVGRTREPKALELWDATLRGILSPEQLKVLQKHLDERSAFRWNTLASINTQLLDVHARFQPKVAEKLQSQIAEVFAKYGEDIESVFSAWNRNNPWYLNSYYNLIGIHAVPEDELIETIGDDGHKIWKEKLHSRGRSYWPRVKEGYEKREKEDAEEKKKADKDVKPAVKKKQ